MVFQKLRFYPHMTVYDNMAFGLKLRKYSKEDIDKRVQEAAEILGLKEFLDRKPADLSGGQRQRVAMGRHCPWCKSILDGRTFVKLRCEIACIHACWNRENPPSYRSYNIYVTHDQTEAMTLATVSLSCLLLKPCRYWYNRTCRTIGTPQEVYKTQWTNS